MDMRKFSFRNLMRCEGEGGFNHSLESWSLSDWMTATLGELGEAANIVKKLNRYRDGIIGNKETEARLKERLASELADAYIYLDLTAQRAGIDFPKAIEDTFNNKSDEIGYVDPYRGA